MVGAPEAHIIPWLTYFVILLALACNLYPVPEGAYGKLPLIFLGYLALGLLWFFWSAKRNKPTLDEDRAEQTLVD
jgi:hypothetical protein